jgi:hypothetical protein
LRIFGEAFIPDPLGLELPAKLAVLRRLYATPTAREADRDVRVLLRRSRFRDGLGSVAKFSVSWALPHSR